MIVNICMRIYMLYLDCAFYILFFYIDKSTKSYYSESTKSYYGGKIMKIKSYDLVRQINYLTSEMEALYHQASLKMQITDSTSVVLYTIYEDGAECLLSNVYKRTGISKQTVNSAIRGLEADGILYLEQYNGRSKKIVLTEKGKNYVIETVAKLYEAEVRAFDDWSQDEVNTYLELMKKYKNCLQKQIEKI